MGEPVLSIEALRIPSDCRASAFERKMLRRILGPVCVEGQWRSRYNDELYEMYGDLTVVQRIKLARLRWAGHVVRMETRKVFLGRPEGRRRRGRPKLRWQDCVEASAIKAGLTDWQKKARDHERFRTLLRQAKTVKRL